MFFSKNKQGGDVREYRACVGDWSQWLRGEAVNEITSIKCLLWGKLCTGDLMSVT